MIFFSSKKKNSIKKNSLNLNQQKSCVQYKNNLINSVHPCHIPVHSLRQDTQDKPSHGVTDSNNTTQQEKIIKKISFVNYSTVSTGKYCTLNSSDHFLKKNLIQMFFLSFSRYINIT